MKKSCLVMTAVFASVLAVNSSALMAQTADVSAKTDQELTKENAALRKQIDRLQLELRNARLHAQAQRLETEKEKLVATPTNTKVGAEGSANLSAQAWTGSAAAISPAATSAYAADLPVKAPPRGAAVGNYGFYAWLDGSYQRINLPKFNLGFKSVNLVTSDTDQGAVSPFDPHASGAGIAGGIGYLLPYAPTSPWFGSDMRVEIAGSYVKATGDQNSSTLVGSETTPASLITTFVLLNGQNFGPFGSLACSGGEGCSFAASLNTDYSAWQISGRLASDYRFGLVTLTPSLGLFGGSAHNNQTFSQALTLIAGGVSFPAGTYNAATSLRWTDLGGRFGLDAKLAVHPWVTLGLGGWVGGADRWTDFAGNDSVHFGISNPHFSSVQENATKTAFLANLEGSVNVSPSPAWTARAFVGLNFDNSVPGFSSPTFIGTLHSANLAVPAAIVYASETSWYAGGGVAYRFY